MELVKTSLSRRKIKLKSFSVNDNLLRSISYDDLITAIESNEKKYDEKTVRKVYNELLNSAQKDAIYDLRSNMSKILKLLGPSPVSSKNLKLGQ